MPEIQVGQPVDIVLKGGGIRHSSVQDILKDRIVLLQVAPPLAESYIGKTIIVTYLTRGDRRVRRCFKSRIVEFREGYITVGRGFPVIIVADISSTEIFDLRAHERYRPQPEIKIRLDDDYLECIDLSFAGAHLVRPSGKRSTLKVGDIILLTVEKDNGRCAREAKVIRQWHTRGTDGPEHVAVVFIKGE